MNKNFFTYDKKNDLVRFARFSKGILANFYIAKNNQLISYFYFKENNKVKIKKIVVIFDSNIKLWHSFLDSYDLTVRAIVKDSKNICFPKVLDRIETDQEGDVKMFTINNNMVNTLLKMKF